MRDLRDNKLLRRLGYVSEAHAYTGAAMGPRSRRYVSAIDDGGAVVYAVRKSGVPVLLVADDALTHYSRAGHAWPNVLAAHNVFWPAASDTGLAFRLTEIRKHTPELLDQQSGKALFNVADANRLLAKYDALQERKRAERAARRKGAR